MKIITLCNDYYHPGKLIEAAVLRATKPYHTLLFIHDTKDFNSLLFEECDLFILARSDQSNVEKFPWLSGEIKERFIQYVKAGKGFLILHAGIIGYGKDPKLKDIFNGYFLHHPPETIVTIDLCPSSEIFTEEFTSFRYSDEHYHLHINDDERINIFAYALSAYGKQPAGWLNTTDGKRVCTLLMGHTSEMLKSVEYISILKKAIDWCLRSFA